MKNLVKVERTRMDLTQAALADKVQVSRQTIIAIENGKFTPSTVLALKIASILQCPLEKLFELEPDDWA